MNETEHPPNDAEGYEDSPLTRQEYLTVMVHFYRGEIQRSTEWRRRLDAIHRRWTEHSFSATRVSLTLALPDRLSRQWHRRITGSA